MCVHACVDANVCDGCVCPCLWRPEALVWNHPWLPSSVLIETVSIWTRSLWIGWSSQSICCGESPRLCISHAGVPTQHLGGFWGSKSWSSHLHLEHQTISQSPPPCGALVERTWKGLDPGLKFSVSPNSSQIVMEGLFWARCCSNWPFSCLALWDLPWTNLPSVSARGFPKGQGTQGSREPDYHLTQL